MKITFLLSLIVMFSGCATRTNWSAKDVSRTTVSYKHGNIEITPIESNDSYSSFKDLFIVNVRITNKTSKLVSFNHEHIIISLASGETVSVLSESEMKSYADQRGAMGTALASGPFANPSHVQNVLFLEMKSEMLSAKSIPPKGHVQGKLWFAIPKNGADLVEFKFFETLKSRDTISFKKDDGSGNRGVASQN
jgi:hypothetical protein